MSKMLWSITPDHGGAFPELVADPPPCAEAPITERARRHQLIREAEREAQALVEAARQKAAILAQEGYRDGRLQGHAEALAESRDRCRHVAQALETAAERLHNLEEEFRSQAAEAIVSLALAVAERVCREAVAQDPTAILSTVRAALTLLPEAEEVTLRVHPDLAAMVQSHREELLGLLEGARSLRILPDPAVESGGCLVEGPGGLVDATLAAQLAEAGRRLRREPQ